MPQLEVTVGSTEVDVAPRDVALVAARAFCVAAAARPRQPPAAARAPALAAAAFSRWLLISSALNGVEAFVAAVKLLEYGVLALGVVLFVRRRIQLWIVVGVVVAFAVVAAVWGCSPSSRLVDADFTGRRQPSFPGEHELAALSTMALVGRARRALRARAPVAAAALAVVRGVAGAIGVVLGAALAGLLGLYSPWRRSSLSRRSRGAATRRAPSRSGRGDGRGHGRRARAALGRPGGVPPLPRARREGGRAGRQRGQLERAARLRLHRRPDLPRQADARHRAGTASCRRRSTSSTSTTRAGASPTCRRTTSRPSDELHPAADVRPGAVRARPRRRGALPRARRASRCARRCGSRARGRAATPTSLRRTCPSAWTAALVGALAGAALFGGIPLTAVFWLTLGVVALAPSLVPPPPRPARPRAARGLLGSCTRSRA